MGIRDRQTKRVVMTLIMNLPVSCRHLLCTWANLSFQEVAGSVVLVVTKYSKKKERNSKAVSLCLSYGASLCQHQLNRQLINWSGVLAAHSPVPELRLTKSNNLEDFLLKGEWSFQDTSHKLTILHGSLYTYFWVQRRSLWFTSQLSANALFSVIFRHLFLYSQERKHESSTLLASSIKSHFRLMFII